jgi:hypothetical protein
VPARRIAMVALYETLTGREVRAEKIGSQCLTDAVVCAENRRARQSIA